MPKALKLPAVSKKTIVRTKQPGVPLLQPIVSTDLMLATLRAQPFSMEGVTSELKYDGFRCLVQKQGERVELTSRPGNSLNRSFPDIVAAVASVPGDFVWDAELTVDHPDGRSSFEALQQRARTSVPSRVLAGAKARPARLYVFDMLAVGIRDLRGLPLSDRKLILRDSFENTDQLVFVNGIVEQGDWVFEQACIHDFEGMVAKRLDSLYQRGRTYDWQKIKNQSYSRKAALGFRKAQP